MKYILTLFFGFVLIMVLIGPDKEGVPVNVLDNRSGKIIQAPYESVPKQELEPVYRTETVFNARVAEYTIDGCQYIRFSSGNDTWGSHKGNCNNPIHYRQK